MTNWQVVFDGSTKIGTVRFGDGIIGVTAYFKTDDEARLFYNMLNEMKNDLFTTDKRLGRVVTAMREALREGDKP